MRWKDALVVGFLSSIIFLGIYFTSTGYSIPILGEMKKGSITGSDMPEIPVIKQGWKKYSDPDAGFTFLYPPEINFNNSFDTFILSATAEKINKSDYPAEREKNSISGGKAGESGKYEETEIVSLGPVNGKSVTEFSSSDTCGVKFSRKLVFYPSDSKAQIIFEARDTDIIYENPQFFTEGDGECKESIFREPDGKRRFLMALKNRQAGDKAQYWYDTYEEMIKTVSLYKKLKIGTK